MSGLAALDLTVSLGGRTVLDKVWARFERGQVTALLGPNGAGKSTLLACLSGLRVPDTGAATLGDAAVAMLPARTRAQRIGLLPQTSDVHWDIDVATLVGLGRFPHRGRWGDTDGDRAAVERALAATDMTRFADRVVNSLSGGERSRALLARVLAGEPEWLLVDEPLAHLDPAHSLDGLDRLRAAAAAGAGVIVVLHDLNHAAYVADAVVLLREGRVVGHGPAHEMLTPAAIGATFGVTAHVATTPDGQRFIVPTARLGDELK